MKVANINIILGADKIKEKIAEIATKGETLDKLLHRTAVSCVYHTQQHGDSTQLTALVDALVAAMPRSGRRAALIDWILAHVPYDSDETVNGKKEFKLKLRKGRKPEDFLVQECAAKPFWEFTPDRSTAPMTLERAIASFERALKKAVTAGSASQDEADMLTKAVAAVMPVANDAGGEVVKLDKAVNS